MPQRVWPLDYMELKFRDTKQRHRYKVLYERTISSTRYPEDDCLRTLGLYDSVHFMYECLHLIHFVALTHKTYVLLTLEFLSSFDYTNLRLVRNVNGDAIFRMFNEEYTLNHDEIGSPFQFNANHLHCTIEILTFGLWTLEFGPLW